MLYHITDLLHQMNLHLPGLGLFKYISFRAALAMIMSLLIATIIGKKIILYLRNKQIGESIRELGLEGQIEKKGTPTMGGIIILIAILIPIILLCDLTNIYVLLMIFVTISMTAIGFADDYIKKFKNDKEGLTARFKLLGQICIGLIFALILYNHPDVVIKREKIKLEHSTITINNSKTINAIQDNFVKAKTPVTTIPFFKSHEFNYAKLLQPFTSNYSQYAWMIFIPLVIFILTAVSNGANITDGIDGLAAGTSAISSIVLLVFAYVSGNILLANYLNVMYIPDTGELVIFISALIGACIGFLWYNTFPAQVFMGDTGSLALGGIIGALAIILRKELLIPIFCGVFLAENLSVMLQVAYFKYTKKKYGEGRRIFLMAPLHHHYQMKGYHESKIVTRFWIITLLLALFTLITLKIR